MTTQTPENLRPGAALAPAYFSYDANKPPHEIEEDIARTRERIGANLQALERELAPKRLIAKGAEKLRSSLVPDERALELWVRSNTGTLVAILTAFALVTLSARRTDGKTPEEELPPADPAVAPVREPAAEPWIVSPASGPVEAAQPEEHRGDPAQALSDTVL